MSDEYAYADLLRDPSVWDDEVSDRQSVARIQGAIGRARRRRRVDRAAVMLAAAACAAIAGAAVLAIGTTSEPASHFAVAHLSGPSGTATASFDEQGAGFRIELAAEQLPDPGPDIYEAWLTDGHDTVAIGTFSRGGTATLWSGASPERLRTIRVTREPVDSDATSSGLVVLEGTVRRSSGS